MKLTIPFFCALLAVSTNPLQAQPRPRDPIGANLIAPELLMKNQDALGLTDEQKDFLKEETRWAQERFKEIQQQLQKETDALVEMLKQELIDEPKALDQFDKIVDLEKQMRRTHLTLAIAIKNKLTPEQQAKAAKMRSEWMEKMATAKPPPKTLQSKMAQLQEGIQQWRDQGIDPGPVGQIMREFQPLMEEQKFAEAEAVLDKALDLLGKHP
jgi:Spy/CpxP family protein refolding chaperone